jgi:mannosidase alpha-like ER degradation enhancer 1
VNLRYGLLAHETTTTCAAGAGTLVLEFGILSRLTDNPIYEKVAKRALKAIYDRRSALGIVGNGINSKTGLWVESLTGVGAGIDSFYEYLLKSDILFGDDPDYFDMFEVSMRSVDRWIKDGSVKFVSIFNESDFCLKISIWRQGI